MAVVEAAGFWASEYGRKVLAGMRLDRALPSYLAEQGVFEGKSDTEIESFYAEDAPQPSYHNFRQAVMDAWPEPSV